MEFLVRVGPIGSGTIITVTPTVTTIYYVRGEGGCVGNSASCASIAITVNTLPVISVNSGIICSGNSFTITPSGANTYTIEGGNSVVSPTTNTSYTVIGTSTAGCISNTFAISSVTVNICTGINEMTSIDYGIIVYPNPSNGLFNLQTTSIIEITIKDVLGKIILSIKINAGSYQINLNDQAKGIYFLKVNSNEQIKIVRLIKQ